MSVKDLQDLESDVRNMAKNFRSSNPTLTLAESIDQAMRVKFESSQEAIASAKTSAKLNALRLAQNRLEAQGLEMDAKAIENAFFVGRGHKGHGVRVV